MKTLFLFIASAVLITSYSYGQENNTEGQYTSYNNESIHIGIKVGTNYSNVYDTEGEEFSADPKFGLATGLFISIPLGSYLGVQPEILFSQKGFKGEGTLLGSSYVLTRTINYIDIPLLVALKPIENISILAGPQYSYMISQKNKFENAETTIAQEEEFDNENLRKNTFCFTGGFDVNVDHLVIGGRVGWDLFKNNGDGTTTTPRYKNVWYQVTLGYRF